ncbi:unnamed protein product [Protopolystoma xenopodis]|uniref:Protein ST7 homolog n=1 Tax=Protopolystoma xenopodis TaxID=117903 RepID=A0A3S5FEC5_9PLAT|nr:unnamed protein product [Protopolystoma xenopodis]
MNVGHRAFDLISDSIPWSLSCFWIIWIALLAVLVYIFYGPFNIIRKVSKAPMFFNTLTPKFCAALAGTSSVISGLILVRFYLQVFEWWYFKKYGTSFIEQISLTHIYPLISGNEDDNFCDNLDSGAPQNSVQECKVCRNPYCLFRGAEYQRLFKEEGKDPLTYYDMNLSAQDHQTFFTCEADAGKPEYEIMQLAWRERSTEERIKKAKEALSRNPECTTAAILIAEEECSSITEIEKILKQSNKIAESALRRSQQSQNQSSLHEAIYRRDLHVSIFIRRRIAMCARKLGKLKEAIKMMKDLIKEYPNLNLFNLHENLIECYLAAQQYADAQAFLAKYDGKCSSYIY